MRDSFPNFLLVTRSQYNSGSLVTSGASVLRRQQCVYKLILVAVPAVFSMIRADYHGLSTAVDYHGNMLSQMNDFTTEERIMLADIPQHGIATIYAQIGDIFAWLCGVGMLRMVWVSVRTSKRQ
jgi:apolipoprotein N-acyltransferase